MADDISELLDEVERKFCSPKTTPNTTVSKTTVNPHGNSKSTPPASSHIRAIAALPEEDDLDHLISEIINDIDTDFPSHVSASLRHVAAYCTYLTRCHQLGNFTLPYQQTNRRRAKYKMNTSETSAPTVSLGIRSGEDSWLLVFLLFYLTDFPTPFSSPPCMPRTLSPSPAPPPLQVCPDPSWWY